MSYLVFFCLPPIPIVHQHRLSFALQIIPLIFGLICFCFLHAFAHTSLVDGFGSTNFHIPGIVHASFFKILQAFSNHNMNDISVYMKSTLPELGFFELEKTGEGGSI